MTKRQSELAASLRAHDARVVAALRKTDPELADAEEAARAEAFEGEVKSLCSREGVRYEVTK
jgi:hypothetical protein